MSETQKSPKMGLSDDSLTGIETAKFSGIQPTRMEINPALALSNSDIAGSIRSANDKHDLKMYNHPYFLPSSGGGGGGNLLPGTLPMMAQDIVSQQLLAAQMQMLSFYQTQIYHQKRLMADESREQIQKLWAEQERVKEMEEKRMETQRLSRIKQKPKEQESAIASNEVKIHLRTALMNKLKRNVHNQSQGDIAESVSRSSWQRSQSNISPPSSRNIPGLGSSMSPPSSLSYRSGAGFASHMPGGQEVEFPIRKTASEPNLKVKSMIKQKLSQDRRNSPLMTRRRQFDKLNNALSEVSVNGYDQLNASPPINLGSTPAISKDTQKAATKRSFEEALSGRSMQPADSLYISMPNIALNKPSGHKPAGPLTDADIRAKQAHKYGLPLTGHLYQSPFQPSIAGISEDEYIQGLSSMAAIHDARRLAHPYLNKASSTLGPSLEQQAMAAQRHIRHPKPLSRTQSAPLPIMHPAAAASLLLPPQQQALLEQQELVKQHQDQILKQQKKSMVIGQLRQALLQRSSSKNHMEQVDEESEARLIQEMQESREDNYESQQKSIYSSHGSLYAAAAAPSSSQPEKQGLDLSTTSSPQRKVGPRYLARTHSSPLVAFAPPPIPSGDVDVPINLATKSSPLDPTKTAVVYDEAMLRHQCPCRDDSQHLENPSRIQSIWSRLQASNLVERCVRVSSKKASIEQLQLCHSESYSLFFGVNSVNRKKLGLNLPDIQFQRLPCGGVGVDADTVWNEEYSHQAIRIAVGSVVELSAHVYERHVKNGMAIVRPPGHHSESGQAMGFCFFNSIAIAAKHLKHKLGASKILILDWDVHHGNGTQQMTYDDPCILYISLHRHDNGMFFPGTGSLSDCGEEQGRGFNVNVPFSGGVEPPMGDAEYMAAFRSIVMPIVREFKPQITLVSAGFDGADGHASQLGGYKLSPAGFGFMTKQLMSACDGRVVLVLEGGYNLTSICDASEMCMRALLGENVPLPNQEEILKAPCPSAVKTLEDCSSIQAQFWPSVSNHRSKIAVSFVDSLREKEESETVNAMASLSMVNSGKKDPAPASKPSGDTEPMEEA